MRIEVVHKGETHWARIKGENGEIVWVTEQYVSAESAHEAVELLEAGFGLPVAASADEGSREWAYEIHEVWE